MKVIAIDKMRPGYTLSDLTPLLKEEAANAWRLWKAGVIRENYDRLDVTALTLFLRNAPGFPVQTGRYSRKKSISGEN